MSASSLLRPAALAALLACAFAAAPVIAADALPKVDKPAAKAAVARKVAPAMAAEPMIASASPEQVRAAEMVYYGTYDCEFKQTVQIDRSQKYPGYVDLKHAKGTWLMKPVLSSTGAIRLEDVRDEALMLQIASKSMLLNTKSGQRIVDDCVSERQRELIAQAKANKVAADAATPPPK